MSSNSKKILCAGVALTLLAGCQTTKKDIGTMIGTAAGIVVGSQIGGGAGRLVAVAAGAVLGGLLGRQIGALLDERDQAMLQQESGKALAASPDGETVSWRNPDTGTTGTLKPVKTVKTERVAKLYKRKDVSIPPNLELIGEDYMTLKRANVRANPSTGGPVVKTLDQNARVQAVAKVPGQDWILVAQQRKTIGYVYAPLMTAAVSDTGVVGQTSVAVMSKEETDSIFGDLDAQGDDSFVVEDVRVVATCREVEMSVKTQEGKSGQENFNACMNTDGSWEIS